MRSELAKLVLLGQYGVKKYVSRNECLAMPLWDVIKYLRREFHHLEMKNLAFILKGIAIVYILQMTNLEGDTKVLLGQMNGDYAWSYLNRKQKGPASPSKAKK